MSMPRRSARYGRSDGRKRPHPSAFGRVRSVDAADMYVSPSHPRRGISRALLIRMLRDDRARVQVLGADGVAHSGAPSTRAWDMNRLGRCHVCAKEGDEALNPSRL